MRERLISAAVLFAMAACAPPGSGDEGVCERTAAYGSDPQQAIDLYPPARAGAPVLLFLHGGAWRTGDKSELEGFARSLAAQDILVAAANYRTAPAHPFPAQIEDVASAARWLSAHARACGGDPTRLLVGGHSAGGHLATLLAVDARWRAAAEVGDRLKGVVAVGGVFMVEAVEGGFPRAIVESVFGPNEEDWNVASPLLIVAGDPALATRQPILILYGDADPLAPEGKRFAAALRDQGLDPVEIEMANADHAAGLAVLADPTSAANAALHALTE